MTASANWRPRWRLRYVLVAVLGAGLLVVIGSAVSSTSGPAVREIAVDMPGNGVLSPDAVRAAAAGAVSGGLLQVNLDAVRRAVEKLPWVARADVRRAWPDALIVRVALEHPVARWGGKALLDARGHVFEPAHAARFKRLPVLSGPENSGAQTLAKYRRLRKLARAAGLSIQSLAENGRGGIRVGFASGLELELGRDDPMGRFARFVNIAVPALGAKLARAATVDMRYPDGFAVGWKGEGDHGKEN